jgi:transposase
MAVTLTEAQWERIRTHVPEEHLPDGRPGRKPVPTRHVLEAVLWIPNTGAQWRRLPRCHPNYKTVHRRFQRWREQEVLRDVLCALANDLREPGSLDARECSVDAMVASAKGGGDQIGPTKRGRGVKIMGIVDRHGLPVAVSMHAANHHEVTLVQLTFDFYMIEAKPEHLIGDQAYDSDQLDKELGEQGMQMIAPHRANRRPAHRTQDGRRLRRAQRRWIVERFFSWNQWRRRIIVRWEYSARNFLGFVQLACALILLKRN